MSLIDRNLYELTKVVFSRRYKFIEKPEELKGESGKKWDFDAIIENEHSEKFGVFIRDWKREISITQLRQLHKACTDIREIAGGIMICNITTDFSKDYSEQFGIQLLSRGHLISKLRNQNFNY
ncbi:MAG: hypothetical protein GF311_19480 [Candidatus Lokiarchaeota archaeon]|jgi:hypothetical protein|nr:hypothetical protein [Candidatus Lokiarchaeota archaeon]